MMKRILSTLLIALLWFSGAYAQKISFKELDDKVDFAIRKAYAASVKIFGFDTIRKMQMSAPFSGVVVDTSGTILTVAHATLTGKTYKVSFPDGRTAIAVALGRTGSLVSTDDPDIAMMKITTPGNWPAAELGWAYSARINEPCIGISYPENLNQFFPTVRFGYISKTLDSNGFLVSTCKMEPGDSGGPLFDYRGRVIGFHSWCGKDENENHEMGVDLYRKYWSALTKYEDYKVLPQDTSVLGVDPMAKKIEIVPGLVHLDQLVPENLLAPGYYPMHIKSKKAEKELVILGTRLVIDGKSYLLSKSSMVGENPTVDVSGKAIELQVLSRDVSKDLVLLMLPPNVNGGIAMGQLKVDQKIHHEDIGSFLVSPTPDKLKVSVVSSGIFNQPRKFSAGFMGMSVIFKDGKTQISRLVPGGPAAASTLKVGDEVLSVNGISIDGPEQYSLELVKSSPGDTINFEGQGEAGRYNTSIILSAWPVRDHSADQFDGGRSVRCDGFSRVFAHDSIITAEQCGGSVFDLSGKFRGINIARFSRTVTLVMPAEEICAFLSQALNKKIQVVQ